MDEIFLDSHRPTRRKTGQLNQLIGDFVARAGGLGFTVEELMEQLQDLLADAHRKRK